MKYDTAVSRLTGFNCLILVFFLLFPAISQAGSKLPSAKKSKQKSIHVHAGQGMASYLGKKFQGRKTASGEIFRHEKLTAAHKNLPFGSVLRVTCLKSRRSVLVRVNDRGPFIKGRQVDLSRAAAKKLDMLRSGVIKVFFEVISDDKGYPLIPGEAFYVLLGEGENWSKGENWQAAARAASSISPKLKKDHAHILRKANIFLKHDPHNLNSLACFFIGLGPFASFEEAHKVFLSLPASIGHELICVTAKKQTIPPHDSVPDTVWDMACGMDDDIDGKAHAFF